MKIGIFPRWVMGYLAVFLLLAASNFYAVWMLQELSTRTIPSMNADIGILDCQKRLVDSLLSQLRYERKYLLTGDSGLYDQFLEAKSEFHQNLDEGRRVADSDIQIIFFDGIEDLHKRYEAVVDEETDLFRSHLDYNAGRYQAEKNRISDGVLNRLKDLEKWVREDVSRRMRGATEAGVSTLKMAFASSVITVLCALLISFFVTRNITGPLTKLVKKTKEISAGRFSYDLKIASPPEISELSKAFGSMCEKLTAVDRMKTDFLSMTSHELRTPLTTIKEGTSLLLEGIGGEINEKQRRLLSILTAETNRLIAMVNSILDLSKMEAGMMTYTFTQSDIGLLIDQAAAEIEPLVEAKGIALSKRVEDGIPFLKIDEDRILQTLRNLLGNAAKFTRDKGRVNITARSVAEGVEVAVEDTGPGIPADRLATVFEKFNGSDPKRGTGLGLAIVKHVIDVHGGRVWVESNPDWGSRFVFVLPHQLRSIRPALVPVPGTDGPIEGKRQRRCNRRFLWLREKS
jgi:two-component system, NtrC family, sensor histidine kinase GlrK